MSECRRVFTSLSYAARVQTRRHSDIHVSEPHYEPDLDYHFYALRNPKVELCVYPDPPNYFPDLWEFLAHDPRGKLQHPGSCNKLLTAHC